MENVVLRAGVIVSDVLLSQTETWHTWAADQCLDNIPVATN